MLHGAASESAASAEFRNWREISGRFSLSRSWSTRFVTCMERKKTSFSWTTTSSLHSGSKKLLRKSGTWVSSVAQNSSEGGFQFNEEWILIRVWTHVFSAKTKC